MPLLIQGKFCYELPHSVFRSMVLLSMTTKQNLRNGFKNPPRQYTMKSQMQNRCWTIFTDDCNLEVYGSLCP